MNSVELEEDIRRLEVMLCGGAPLRPDADFGKGEVGYFENVKARDPLVHIEAHRLNKEAKELVLERRVLKRKGKITISGPKHHPNH